MLDGKIRALSNLLFLIFFPQQLPEQVVTPNTLEEAFALMSF
jgi:hypothetical protein